MMTGPGLALFYCGLVRKKNVLERHDAVRLPDVPDDASSGPSTATRSPSAATVSRRHGSATFDHLFMNGVEPTWDRTASPVTPVIPRR